MHEDIVTIELVHSAWIDYERAGDLDGLFTLCAYDIEFWPPNAPPVVGHEQVARYLRYPETVIHDIRVSDRRVRVSHEFAYLTAKYQSTIASQNQSATTVAGSHLWILRKDADNWMVTLVAWSVWM